MALPAFYVIVRCPSFFGRPLIVGIYLLCLCLHTVLSINQASSAVWTHYRCFSHLHPPLLNTSLPSLVLCVNLTVIVLLKIFSLLSRYSRRSSCRNLCQPLKSQILGQDHVALYPRLAKKHQKFWMLLRSFPQPRVHLFWYC